MAQRVNQGLSMERWPVGDRAAWQVAVSNADIFADNTFAALSETTLYGRLATYRQWLGYWATADPDVLDLPMAERFSIANVEAYVGHLRENCREATVATEIQRLFLVMRVLCPSYDWGWLNRISRRIFRHAQPLKHREANAVEIYEVGLFLMDTASEKMIRQRKLTLSCGLRFRDGLLIALLIEAPMRRGPLSRLQVNQHLRKVGQSWHIDVPAELTKTSAQQSYMVSERLSKYLDVFLEQVRPAFRNAEKHGFLWPHTERPMTDRMIWRRVIKRTEDGLGFAVPPHRFRNAAATFLAMQDPANAFAARDLLGHRSLTMTKKHYVDRAQSRIAGRQLANILAAYQEK